MPATLQSRPRAGKPAVTQESQDGLARAEFAVAPSEGLGDSAPFMPASSAFPALRACPPKPGCSPAPRDERPSNKTTHMSDIEKSGEPASAAAATSGTFGSTRGSGLARGKRPSTPAAPPASASAGGYTPSSLEVITSKSEYVNPFTGETTVSAPVVNEPTSTPASAKVNAPQAAPTPAPAPVVAPVAAPVVVKAAPAPAPQAAPAPVSEMFPFSPAGTAGARPAPAAESIPKPELKILPPEETKRASLSWEASSAGAGQPQRRDERATFRTERNRREGAEGKPFEPREPRRENRNFEPRTNQPYQPRDDRPARDDRPERSEPTAAPASEKKSSGFFGWLKGLFGGKSAESPAPGSAGGEPRRDGDQGQRRHRGGWGRGRGGFRGDSRGGQPFQHRDPRDEPDQPRHGGEHQHGGEPRGEGDGGGRRRRRGGRGRFRGEGGDGGDRGGPRPEGQQGGGAI